MKKTNDKYQAFIDDFKAYSQFPNYPTGCEITALYTLLKYYGISVTRENLNKYLSKGEKPHLENNIMYGGDPEEEFVGEPTDIHSYGVYDKPIENLANKFKPGIKNITGTSLKDVLKLVKKGYPVQVWASINLLKPYLSKSWINKKSGKKITWKAQLHSLVLIGYNEEVVVVSDPYTGTIREFDIQTFEEYYNYFGKRALYYEE